MNKMKKHKKSQLYNIHGRRNFHCGYELVLYQSIQNNIHSSLILLFYNINIQYNICIKQHSLVTYSERCLHYPVLQPFRANHKSLRDFFTNQH